MASTSRRGVIRAAFTRAYNGLLPLLSGVDADLSEVNGRFRLLEGKHLELVECNQKCQAELFEANPGEFDETLLADIESCDDYELKYHTIKCKVESLMPPGPTVGSGSSECNDKSDKKTKIQLPKLQLRQFNGDISQWIAFWSQFSSIDLDRDLSDEDKFQYLIQATTQGSRARALVDSFPPSAKNYPKALAALKGRFGRSDLLVEHYVRALLQLVVSKQEMKLCELYDSLETQVRALESLDIVSDQYAALLLPLIESCIPIDILKVWQRSNTDHSASLKSQMDALMKFLRTEVEAEERVAMATSGALISGKSNQNHSGRSATAADLANLSIKDKCVFCQACHKVADCQKAASMSLDEKRAVLKQARACFGCAMLNHPARRCRAKCACGGRHIGLLCPKSKQSEKKANAEPSQPKAGGSQEASLLSVDHALSVGDSSEVFLQTFAAVLYNGDKLRKVRVLVDSGSQRSYILKKLAQDLDYKPFGEENLVHSLFGGGSMGMVKHISYKIRLRSLKNDYACNFTALDQGNIAAFVPQVTVDHELQHELAEHKIQLIEDSPGPVDILIGADIAGKIWSGSRRVLSSGVVAVETQFGWTLMGVNKKNRDTVNSGLAMTHTMVSILSGDESDLWKFEAIGICDPIEKSGREKCRLDALEHFRSTVEFVNGRYRVRLPWNEMMLDLPSNRGMAEKRLAVTKRKLADDDHLFREYDQIFKDWMELSIIEETTDNGTGHYLPHRPVIKESSSTTKVRPVFDASARLPGRPSLNDCLESGPNMIELIPDILIGFRKHGIGVSADIEKAFLQIEINPIDREYLKFLWTTFDKENPGALKSVTMRHNRVVFGVTCSPFLLAAVIDYHIDRMIEEADPTVMKWLQRMKKSFYVDNLVCSLDTLPEVLEFKGVASEAMAKGGFNLRGWEYTLDGGNDSSTSILGLKWDRQRDVLGLNMSWWRGWSETEGLTKRNVYSMVQRIYDPIGFCSPVTVNLKRLIQTVWEQKLEWDDKLSDETMQNFRGVLQDAHMLQEISVGRCLGGTRNRSLHLFCDASAKAYAACIFIRSETDDNKVLVNLVQAKSKIVNANTQPTIPRLELMGATIGVRLLKSVRDALDWKDVPVYGWCDSSTVLAWIQRQEEWSVFVRNRVREIRELGSFVVWRHVPGQMNPADLPSRGCTIAQLLKLRWWEGPSWLYNGEDAWPQSHCTYVEEEVASERIVKKATISCLAGGLDASWLYGYFSKFEQIVRMVAFIKRFAYNCRNKQNAGMKRGELCVEELLAAENVVWRLVQGESFDSLKDKMICDLRPFTDETGVIRVKTKIAEREDFKSFTTPILLPHNHPVVERMVVDRHKRLGHVGAQTLWTDMREHFWVLKGRQLARGVVRRCVTCRRFGCRNFDTESPPLPHTRVTDGSVFEVCGVDYAGPLTLADDQKVWIALFTCGVYRAVHLEIVTSLSTEAFLLTLRRFIARRGRPKIMYSDNGTCFRGADNAFNSIDWDEISRVCSVERISWRFNPPSASWWGGFFERMVQTVKRVLRRILGKASLNLEELYTMLCECESQINSRPITYISGNNEDPSPLTPALFLQDIQTWETPDCDVIDRDNLNRRLKYRQSLRDQLRVRFRSEYLGCLTWAHRRGTREPDVGEVVLVGSDDMKRLNWPLARVEKVIRGSDGNIRVLHLKTSKGLWIRPLQRVFPLEIDVVAPPAEVEVYEPAQPAPEVALDASPSNEEGQPDSETDSLTEDEVDPPSGVPTSHVTRCGRQVRKPSRLDI